jgi:predicted deacylase
MPERQLNVGTARGEPGRWTKGRLTLGEYADGAIESPVNLLCGARPGNVLWVQNAVHGDEAGGAIGILRFLHRCDPARMSGSIVALMVANQPAFRAQARLTPFDGENMNRCFPGARGGGHTRAAASVLIDTACEAADAVIDLHSGGNEAIVPFYTIYRDDGSAAAEASRKLAVATGAETVWACCDSWLEGALFANVVKRGKPSVLIECGGGGPVLEEHIDDFADALEGIARSLEILPPPAATGNVSRPSGAGPGPAAARAREPRVIDGCAFVVNRRGGYFEPLVRAGDVVEAGQRIARILSPYGEVLEELGSPVGPAFIASIVRAYLPIHSGIEVAEAIRITKPLGA